MHTMFVQVMPKCHRWGSAKGIEIYAISSFVVDEYLSLSSDSGNVELW